jgi:lysophospholipase L1-like esterase
MSTPRKFFRRLAGLFLVVGLGLLALPVHTLAALPAAALAGRRVLVLGDSITQDGRYVSYLEYYLDRLDAGPACDLISIGLSSETVSGLSEKSHPFPRPCVLERLDRALKAVDPQVVFACYGMNDGIYFPPAPERYAAFDAGLHQLIAAVRAAGIARLVLLTPPVFDPLPIKARTVPANAPEFGYSSPYAGYDEVLAEFTRRELALHEPGVEVIDLHGAMAAALAARRAQDADFSFTRDGVHPDDAGHLLLARTIVAALGFTLPPADLMAERARINADPLFPLVSARRELRSEAWLPFVGYTRERIFKSASVKAEEVVATRMQQQIETIRATPPPTAGK